MSGHFPEFGEKVSCSAYIKSSGNCYEKATASECLCWERGAESGIVVEDCHSCERYKTIEKEFCGIYVGTTTLCTQLNAEYYEDKYGGSGFLTYCDEPEKFAVVYYANNKKRIVPIDKVEVAK